MAVAYISEFTSIGYSGALLPQAPAIATQAIAISTAFSTSAAFNAATKVIEVNTDAICLINIGTTLDASSTNGWRLAAGASRVYGVQPGQKLRLVSAS